MVETDLLHPEADLVRNSWLAFRGGELVAYGLLWDDSGAERIDVDHYVLPGHQDAGEQLIELMEARAAERAAENGVERAVVHLSLNIRPTLDTGRLRQRGWQTVRRYNVLTRPLSAAADPVPELPAGLTLRDCVDEADRRRAHELVEETFAEHYDHHPRSYRQWLDDLGAGMDWSLVWIASQEGSGDVAVMLSRDDRTAMGWIRNLGVLKQARGRGIAGHLLRHAFGVYAARGRDTIGLGVDTTNATGALRLYLAHRHDPPFRCGHLGVDSSRAHARPSGRRRATDVASAVRDRRGAHECTARRPLRSEAGEQMVERGGYAVLVQRLDEHPPVVDLAALLRAEEAPQLLLRGAVPLCGLAHERLEGTQVALRPDEFFHACRAQRTDEFVLQVRRADEELLVCRPVALQGAGVVGTLPLVAESRETEAQAGRPEETGEASDAHRAAHRQDADSFGRQVPAPARGQCVDRCDVARPFEQDDRPHSQSARPAPRGVAGPTGRPRDHRFPERPHVSHERSLRPDLGTAVGIFRGTGSV